MVKKAIWLVAIAGAIGFAAYWWQSAPVSDSAPASTGPSGDAAGMTDTAISPRAFIAAKGSEPPPTADEILAQLFEAIRDGLDSADEAERDLVFTNLLPQLVALDSAAAGRLAESIEDEAGRRDVLRGVAQGWGSKDPAAALAWAAGLSDTNDQRGTLTDVAFQMAHSDPARAMAAAQQYHLDEGIGDVLPALAVQWAEQDLPAALAWAGEQPAGDQRDQILARVGFVQSRTAPAEAGAMVLAEIPPGPVQEEAVMSVLNQWAQKDLSGVSAWVQAFPEGPFKERALAELAAVGRSRPPEPAGPQVAR
jgi:hypothetical protein